MSERPTRASELDAPVKASQVKPASDGRQPADIRNAAVERVLERKRMMESAQTPVRTRAVRVRDLEPGQVIDSSKPGALPVGEHKVTKLRRSGSSFVTVWCGGAEYLLHESAVVSVKVGT